MKIQNTPVTDSPNNDAFEAIVEVYYQANGYITSAGKWFWVWEEGKKQRGYQDIDVLAINGHETLIISVTSNLDDKVNTKGGEVNEEKQDRLKNHFDRVKSYLCSVSEYQWMVQNDRKVRYIVAYINASVRTFEFIKNSLAAEEIEMISGKDMLVSLKSSSSQENIKVQNQMLRTIQLMNYLSV